MKPNEFCYWLMGLFELAKPAALTPEQTEIIKRHLALVFKHDLDCPDPTGELQAIHDGKPWPASVPDNATTKPPDTLYRC